MRWPSLIQINVHEVTPVKRKMGPAERWVHNFFRHPVLIRNTVITAFRNARSRLGWRYFRTELVDYKVNTLDPNGWDMVESGKMMQETPDPETAINLIESTYMVVKTIPGGKLDPVTKKIIEIGIKSEKELIEKRRNNLKNKERK